jgi:hypothetical protein
MSTNTQHTVGNIRGRVKVIAAVAAAGAVVTMGAVTAALGGAEAPVVRATQIGGAGDTSTAAPTPSTRSVAKAAPDVLAPGWKAHWPN